MAAEQLERYCRNNRLSFISSVLVSATLLVAMWAFVPHETLLAWMGLLLLVQGGQFWYSMYYLRCEASAEQKQAGWMSGLMVAAIASGLAWGSSFFMLGLSDGQPAAVLMIFATAGITAYAAVAKSDVFPLAIAFEAAALLPMCLWLFMQDGPVARYMGIIALLYLLLLNFLLRQISSMVRRVHSLANENSKLVAAQARDISERKKTLERLEQAQSIAKLGSWDWDVLANRVEWSEMAYEIYSPDERPEHPSFEEFKQSLHPDDLDRVVAAVTSAFENDTPFDLEHRVVSESRGVRTVHAQGKVFRNEEGQPIRMMGTVQDISERKSMEAEIATREQEFRSLAESSPDFIFRVDHEHRVRYVNDHLARLLGFDSAAELYGKLRIEIWPDERFRTIEAAEAEAMQSGEPCSVELELPLEGGLVGYHHILVVPERDADGNIIGSIAFGRDVTHMKRMELALATREQEFRSLAESSPDFIVRVDRELRIRYMNEILARFLGYDSPAEVYGKMRSELPGYECSQQIVAAEAEAMESGRPCSVELDFPQEDGLVVYHHVLVVPEHDADGNIIGSISFGRDVTHMKRLDVALAAREEEFRSLAENSPDPIYRYDRNCRRIYANQAVERLTGFAREALLGKTPTEFVPVPSVDACRAQQAIQSVLDSGQSAELEIAFVNAHGKEVSVHNVFVPEFDAAGKVKSVLCIGRDISERKVAEHELAEREAFLVSLLDAIPIPVFYKDRQGRYLGINRAFEHFFGAERKQLLGKSVFDTHPKELAETYHAKDVEVFERRMERQEYEFVIKHSNGSLRNVLFSKAAFTDPHDQVKGLIGAVMDITERKRMEVELAEREREFRTLVENSADTVARYDRELCCLYANPAFGKMVKGGGNALGKHPSEMPGGEWALVYEKKLSEAISYGEPVEFELKWQSKDSQDVYSLINLTPEFDTEGNVVSVLAVGRDITELYAYRQKIHRMAFYDPLTALPNRALFNDRLRQMITDASWHNQLAGVMMIDMDRFKTVNDTMGHAVGDKLLCETGARLSTCLRTYDTVARLGGDEFAVLLPNVRSGDDLGTIADKMRSVFDTPFLLEGKEVFISCSIGIALYPVDSIDADDLVKYADSAMYYAKHSGRNNFRFYANNLTESANERLTLESELRHALERNEFSLHFQPKVCLENGMMIGSEALLRWQRPQHGFLPPDKFIPIAEDSGLIVELGEWVLREACRIACEMNGAGRSLHKVAINLSARQFMSNDLVETVTRVLEETGCYPEWIELEITESLLLDEYGDVLDTLKAFRALGITIAIDDFGTGYSALSYLARFPINTLKIDRSFINTMTTDKYCAELVKAILSIASSLGQQVVAEGVETDEQALFLQTHNCEVAQGYLFSKPVPWEELLALSGNYELERLNKSSKLVNS